MRRASWLGFVFVFGVVLQARASPPAPFQGDDYYQRVWGVVMNKRIVTREIATSDVTSERRKFLEVTLRIESVEIVRVIDGHPAATGPDDRPPRPPDGRKEHLTTFYFEPGSLVRKGERLLVETRSQKQVSESWTSSLYGATFKSLERPRARD